VNGQVLRLRFLHGYTTIEHGRAPRLMSGKVRVLPACLEPGGTHVQDGTLPKNTVKRKGWTGDEP
jgi:hypothetical protein